MQVNYNFNEVAILSNKQTYINSLPSFNKSFYGANSFEDMQKELNKPFVLSGKNEAPQITSFNTCLDVYGFAPNVAAYLNNEPENMYNFESSEAPNLIELNIYISLPYSIDAAAIAKQGQILAKFLSENTTAKDRFKVTFYNNSTGNNFLNSKKLANIENLELVIELCNYNDYITDYLLNLICSPGFYRYYILSCRNFANGFNDFKLNGYPVIFNNLPTGHNYLDFMNMQTELNKIKIR